MLGGLPSVIAAAEMSVVNEKGIVHDGLTIMECAMEKTPIDLQQQTRNVSH